MVSALTLVGRVLVVAAILFAALRPESGVLFQGAWAALGLGLVGLGICLDRQRAQASAARVEAGKRRER